MAWNLPDGVTDADIERAAPGSDDEPRGTCDHVATFRAPGLLTHQPWEPSDSTTRRLSDGRYCVDADFVRRADRLRITVTYYYLLRDAYPGDPGFRALAHILNSGQDPREFAGQLIPLDSQQALREMTAPCLSVADHQCHCGNWACRGHRVFCDRCSTLVCMRCSVAWGNGYYCPTCLKRTPVAPPTLELVAAGGAL